MRMLLVVEFPATLCVGGLIRVCITVDVILLKGGTVIHLEDIINARVCVREVPASAVVILNILIYSLFTLHSPSLSPPGVQKFSP